jgi:hypothetical protein
MISVKYIQQRTLCSIRIYSTISGWGGKNVISGSEYDRKACCLVEFDYQLKWSWWYNFIPVCNLNFIMMAPRWQWPHRYGVHGLRRLEWKSRRLEPRSKTGCSVLSLVFSEYPRKVSLVDTETGSGLENSGTETWCLTWSKRRLFLAECKQYLGPTNSPVYWNSGSWKSQCNYIERHVRKTWVYTSTLHKSPWRNT